MILIPIFGIHFLLLPMRPLKGSSLEYPYEVGDDEDGRFDDDGDICEPLKSFSLDYWIIYLNTCTWWVKIVRFPEPPAQGSG